MNVPLRDQLERLHRLIWDTPPDEMPHWQWRLVRTARLAVAVASDFTSGDLGLRAMSLVFTTLLSLVPLIAVSFSVLKGFGVHNQVEPTLQQFLAPLGPRADEVTQRIVTFVDNIDVSVLGGVAIGFLLFTAISLVQKVEEAFNYTWNVVRPRSVLRRFSDYFSVLVIGPLLVFLALGITASLTNSAFVQMLLEIEPFGVLLNTVGRVVPYLLVIAAFTFIYMLMPNTSVRFRPALFGGVVAGVAWETVGKLFATFVATSTNYTVIYSGFAILLLLLVWLHLSWLILLTGSAIAFYRQHPESLLAGGRAQVQLSSVQAEYLGLALLVAIVRDWYAGEDAPRTDQLARRLCLPLQSVERVLGILDEGGLITEERGDPPGVLPAQPPERITVKQVLDLIRRHGGLPYFPEDRRAVESRMMADVDAALAAAAGGTTIADLARADDQVQMATGTAPGVARVGERERERGGASG